MFSKYDYAINIKGFNTVACKYQNSEYVNITNIARYRRPHNPNKAITNWMSNKGTLLLLTNWEHAHNPNFVQLPYNSFLYEMPYPKILYTVTQWLKDTNAIGFVVKAGNGGGTYAHRDIALLFAEWAAVEMHVEVACQSDAFKDSKRMCKILKFIPPNNIFNQINNI